MKKSRVALLLAIGATALVSNLALATPSEEAVFGEKLINAGSKELRSRAQRLQTSAGSPDTVYVGYTPGQQSATNWWSVYAVGGKAGGRRPPAQGGMWDFEPTAGSYLHGDSLQGWWPVRRWMNSMRFELNDFDRPWTCLDYGNAANYVLPGSSRTFGVVGVWHVDGGSTVAGGGGVGWAPLAGSASAWMGLRRHGDNSYIDPITKNAFNEDVMALTGTQGSVSAGGADMAFPGYGGMMDQMLYRDIDVTGVTSLAISFAYATEMSTNFTTNNVTRRGWFQHDPLAVITGGSNPNFISAGKAPGPAPADSFMVYVGAPAEGSVILSDGDTHSIYDAKRRWFGEVIRSNEGLYLQLLSAAGTGAGTPTFNLTQAQIDAARGGGNTLRLVFRVKTNGAFSDQDFAAGGYSSGGRGAAQVDAVTVSKNGGGATSIGGFENPNEIDNTATGISTTVWRSTGKPLNPQNHLHPLLGRAGGYDVLTWKDLCGPVDSQIRLCNMVGSVIADGDHDNGEKAAGAPGTATNEVWKWIWSPTLNFVAGGTPNNMGLTADDVDVTDDYYINYEFYSGNTGLLTEGGLWQWAFQAYPGGNTGSGAGEHKKWGNIHTPGFRYYNPTVQCVPDFSIGVKQNGMLKTTNPSGIPDSCRFAMGRIQEAYRFGVGLAASQNSEGFYFDNISLALKDAEEGGGDPVLVEIWHWINDTFPATDVQGLAGTPAKFDTTSALIKIGLATGPDTGNLNRYMVPGDTVHIQATGINTRVDMVFRILPGPGNYVNPANGPTSALKEIPTAATAVSAATPLSNFWKNYMVNNGEKGSANGHNAATGKWDPQTWNSARCDTIEVNSWNLASRGNVQPAGSDAFMSAYHEADLFGPDENVLGALDGVRGPIGIKRPVCFIATATTAQPTTAVICQPEPSLGTDGVYPPTWATAGAGYPTTVTPAGLYGPISPKQVEGTKIIPDGHLTPGSHVQYFFRRENIGLGETAMCPDTNTVFIQPSESSYDGHRWQEFSVLPDRWKSPSYVHPVLGSAGAGEACMFVYDAADRRGSELFWSGIADSIGATAAAKYGANNGWHRSGDPNLDWNDPSNFVRKHIGSAGTTWDKYDVKGGESSIGTAAGSIGAREGQKDPANVQINGKSSKLAPTQEMLNTYYRIVLMLTRDLVAALGPGLNRSSNDKLVLENFVKNGNASVPDRGLFVWGEDFAEREDPVFVANILGAELRDPSLFLLSGFPGGTSDLTPTSVIDPGADDVYGARNACTFTLDVLDQAAGLSAETTPGTFYQAYGVNQPYIASIVKSHSATNPWISVLDGTSPDRLREGRLAYSYNVFANVFGAICDVQGAPGTTTDTPRNNDGRLFNFMSLRNNPLRQGQATVDFGLAKAERVKLQIFDVSGRLIRTLADRTFPAGEHTLTWDGVDNGGKQVARGVYFVRSSHEDSKYTGRSKLIVLK